MDVICGWNVANAFLKKSFEERIYVTPLKINCLVYLLYSDYLFKSGETLFSEPFIKTEKGPVLSTVEAKFGSFKNNIISKYAKDAKGHICGVNGELFDEELLFIWNKYKNMSDIEILKFINRSEVFHKKEIDDIISDEEILEDEIKRNEIILQNAKLNRKKLLNKLK